MDGITEQAINHQLSQFFLSLLWKFKLFKNNSKQTDRFAQTSRAHFFTHSCTLSATNHQPKTLRRSRLRWTRWTKIALPSNTCNKVCRQAWDEHEDLTSSIHHRLCNLFGKLYNLQLRRNRFVYIAKYFSLPHPTRVVIFITKSMKLLWQ